MRTSWMKGMVLAAGTAFISLVAGCAAPDSGLDETESELIVGGDVALGSERTIVANGMGYNPRFDHSHKPWSSRGGRDFAGALEQSQASMIRYPGGTFANYWDYDRDAYFPAQSSSAKDGWVQTSNVHPDDIADFIREATRTGTFPKYPVDDLATVAAGGDGVNVVFHMNMVTPGQDFYESPQGRDRKLHPNPGTRCTSKDSDDWCWMLWDRYQRFKRMLRRAQEKGIDVRFVELGNEYYFGHEYIKQAFPTGRDHAVAANYIADLVHSDFGDNVRIAATASMVFGDGPRAKTWNEDLDAALDRSKVGFVTLHAYRAFDKEAKYTDANFRDALAKWTNQAENKLQDTGAKRFLTSGEGRSRIWYTETNANWDGSLDPGDGTAQDEQKWAQSLAEAYSTVFLYDKGDAAILLQFFFNGLVRKDPVDGHLLYNRALAMEPFMRASEGATTVRALNVPGMATIRDTQRSLVNGLCFHRDEGTRCAILNLTGQPVQVNFDRAFRASGVHVEGYASQLDSTAVPRAIALDASTNDVRLPPHSVVWISPR